MNKLELFPTTVFTHDCDLDTVEMLGMCYKYRDFCEDNVGEGRIHKHSSTTNQYHMFSDKKLNKLIETLANEIYPLGSDLSIYCWININKVSDSNCLHAHGDHDTFMSGVYYLKVPKNSGDLIFKNPNVNSFDVAFADKESSLVSIQPKENQLIFFDKVLYHGVGENKSNEDRVSIAFNIAKANGVSASDRLSRIELYAAKVKEYEENLEVLRYHLDHEMAQKVIEAANESVY